MSTFRVVYHLARADFLERVRRYSFLVMLGAVVFLGYQVANGNLTLELGQYRGVYNSAWVGAMMALVASFFLGWFGFYLIKGSVARDRETGVGQIMATTPLTRPIYLIGKWLSNFAVLMAMVAVLALVGIVIQMLQGESTQIDLGPFLDPFVFITMPLMAFVAAVAVLFESVSFLQGGFGNVAYFFGFLMALPLFMENSTLIKYPAYEPMGLALLADHMGKAVSAIYPAYNGDFSLGGGDLAPGATITFLWNGIHWTSDLIFARFTLFILAIAFTSFAALFFDRFDPSRSKPSRRKSNASHPKPQVVSTPQALSQPVHLTPLTTSLNSFVFIRVLVSELKLLVKGLRWWWYAVAGGLFIASLTSPTEVVRAFILPVAWVWPILIWSGLGNREIYNNTSQMVFSSAAPLMRQLPATWLAGFIVTALTGSGAALNMMVRGDTVGLLVWISGAIFIPSLALSLGIWSNSHKLFEVIYLTLWYFGPMNKVDAIDYLGANSSGNIGFFIPLSIALIVAAFIGRARQLQN